MSSYAMEILVRQRMNERLDEADRNRLARLAADGRTPVRPWHATLTLAITRRGSRVAAAS